MVLVGMESRVDVVEVFVNESIRVFGVDVVFVWVFVDDTIIMFVG